MDYYKYAIEKIEICIREINVIHNNIELFQAKESLEYIVADSVHAIVDCYERIDKISLSDEDDVYFRAFSYVNNQIKHDMNLQIFCYPVSGSMYPMRFPMRFGPPGIVWNDFEDNGRTKARGKREHYDACLKRKDVKNTLETMKEIVQKVEALKGSIASSDLAGICQPSTEENAN